MMRGGLVLALVLCAAVLSTATPHPALRASHAHSRAKHLARHLAESEHVGDNKHAKHVTTHTKHAVLAPKELEETHPVPDDRGNDERAVNMLGGAVRGSFVGSLVGTAITLGAGNTDAVGWMRNLGVGGVAGAIAEALLSAFDPPKTKNGDNTPTSTTPQDAAVISAATAIVNNSSASGYGADSDQDYARYGECLRTFAHDASAEHCNNFDGAYGVTDAFAAALREETMVIAAAFKPKQARTGILFEQQGGRRINDVMHHILRRTKAQIAFSCAAKGSRCQDKAVPESVLTADIGLSPDCVDNVLFADDSSALMGSLRKRAHTLSLALASSSRPIMWGESPEIAAAVSVCVRVAIKGVGAGEYKGELECEGEIAERAVNSDCDVFRHHINIPALVSSYNVEAVKQRAKSNAILLTPGSQDLEEAHSDFELYTSPPALPVRPVGRLTRSLEEEPADTNAHHHHAQPSHHHRAGIVSAHHQTIRSLEEVPSGMFYMQFAMMTRTRSPGIMMHAFANAEMTEFLGEFANVETFRGQGNAVVAFTARGGWRDTNSDENNRQTQYQIRFAAEKFAQAKVVEFGALAKKLTTLLQPTSKSSRRNVLRSATTLMGPMVLAEPKEVYDNWKDSVTVEMTATTLKLAKEQLKLEFEADHSESEYEEDSSAVSARAEQLLAKHISPPAFISWVLTEGPFFRYLWSTYMPDHHASLVQARRGAIDWVAEKITKENLFVQSGTATFWFSCREGVTNDIDAWIMPKPGKSLTFEEGTRPKYRSDEHGELVMNPADDGMTVTTPFTWESGADFPIQIHRENQVQEPVDATITEKPPSFLLERSVIDPRLRSLVFRPRALRLLKAQKRVWDEHKKRAKWWTENKPSAEANTGDLTDTELEGYVSARNEYCENAGLEDVERYVALFNANGIPKGWDPVDEELEPEVHRLQAAYELNDKRDASSKSFMCERFELLPTGRLNVYFHAGDRGHVEGGDVHFNTVFQPFMRYMVNDQAALSVQFAQSYETDVYTPYGALNGNYKFLWQKTSAAYKQAAVKAWVEDHGGVNTIPCDLHILMKIKLMLQGLDGQRKVIPGTHNTDVPKNAAKFKNDVGDLQCMCDIPVGECIYGTTETPGLLVGSEAQKTDPRVYLCDFIVRLLGTPASIKGTLMTTPRLVRTAMGLSEDPAVPGALGGFADKMAMSLAAHMSSKDDTGSKAMRVSGGKLLPASYQYYGAKAIEYLQGLYEEPNADKALLKRLMDHIASLMEDEVVPEYGD